MPALEQGRQVEHVKHGERLCSGCLEVDLTSFYADNVSAQYVALGTIEDLSKKGNCKLCRVILEALPPCPNWLLPDGTSTLLSLRWEGRRQSIHIVETKTGGSVGELQLLHKIPQTDNLASGSATFRWSQLLAVIGRKPPSPSGLCKQPQEYQTSIDDPLYTTRLDFSVFQKAIHECDKGHSQLCIGSRHEFQTHDNIQLLFIDVRRKRLVQARPNQRYVTLSYVWGDVKMLYTTKSNLSELKKDKALIRFQDQIPQVVKDAIEIVSALDMPYLWVDALCIVQDDLEKKAAQITRMNVIYSGAQVTLVALHGNDAQTSLRGASSTRLAVLEAIDLGNDWKLTSLPPALSPILSLSHYNSRAWTFQEQILSRRCMFFTENQIYLQCNSCICCEDGIPRYGLNSRIDLGLLNPLIETRFYVPEKSQIRFYVYQNLVEQYTSKNMTYSSDILNAFSGIMAAQEAVYGSFICGLPETVVDMALLWVSLGPHQRRKAVDQPYPSWSWSGWTGPAFHPLWLFDEPPEENACLLKSCLDKVQVCLSERPGDHRAVIRRMDLAPRSSQWLGKNDVGAFTASASGSLFPALHFWTTSVPFNNFEASVRVRLPVLSFRGAAKSAHSINTEGLIITSLLDRNHHRCGVLFGSEVQTLSNNQSSYEFILLSEIERVILRGKDTSGELFEESHFTITAWCTLNVMLVDRKEETVNRVAIGIIHRDAWFKADVTFRSIWLA